MARNCSWVPLRIDFPSDGIAGTPFDGQTNLKLGTGCEDSNAFEQYTLREYLSYPLFNLVTPLSFRARLARATYVEESSQKKITTRPTRCSSSTRTMSPAATKGGSSSSRASSSRRSTPKR